MTESTAEGRRRWRRRTMRAPWVRIAALEVAIVAACAMLGMAAAQHASRIEAELVRQTAELQRIVSEAPAISAAHGSVINHGTTFTITCDTTAAGVPITDSGGGVSWSDLYCENNSTTSAFWGFPVSGTLDTSKAPCVSTTAASCLGSAFTISTGRTGGLACKTASSTATLKCNAGGP